MNGAGWRHARGMSSWVWPFLLIGAAAAAVLGAHEAGQAGGPDPLASRASPQAEQLVTYDWPVDGEGEVLRDFNAPELPWGSGHRGVDLALGPGAPVRAAGNGVVAHAGDVAGRGVVSVDHADGLRTTYEPVSAEVAVGDEVAQGEVLGLLTAGDHCGEQSCLHWGARHAPRDYVDPLSLLGDLRVRLLPTLGD